MRSNTCHKNKWNYHSDLVNPFTRSPTADPRHSRESTKRHLKSGVISCTFSRLFRIKMPTTKIVTNKIGLLWCHSLFELRLLEVEMNLSGISLTRLSYYYVAAILFFFSSNFIFIFHFIIFIFFIFIVLSFLFILFFYLILIYYFYFF